MNGEFTVDRVEIYIITLQHDVETMLPKIPSSTSRKPWNLQNELTHLSFALFTSNVTMLENANYIAPCDWWYARSYIPIIE